MVKKKLVARSNKMGEYLRTRLLEVKSNTGGIKEVRGRGLMNVLLLTEGHQAKIVFTKLLEKGFFTGYSDIHNLLRLYPPLIISAKEIDAFCSSLEQILLK